MKITHISIMEFSSDSRNNIVYLCTVGVMYECCSTLSTPPLRLHFDFPVINNALLCSVLHLFPVVTSVLLNKL